LCHQKFMFVYLMLRLAGVRDRLFKCHVSSVKMRARFVGTFHR
jgi:hypothetical protein